MKQSHEYSYTDHARIRICQRGITTEEIQSIVESGTCVLKQGLRFYYGGSKLADKFHEQGLSDSSRNLVVVMDGEENVVITCYKNENGVRHIRKKSKRLC